MKKKLNITYVFIGINVLIFLFMKFFGDFSYSSLVKFGAKVNFKIADFNIKNLIMPAFLHADLMHLAMNCFAIYILGPFIEMMLEKKYIFFILFTGIFSSIGSFIFSNSISIGASGVVYAFLAFHLYLYIFDRIRYLQVFDRSILFYIAINVVYSFLVPRIDIYGHLFGFVSSFIFLFLFYDFLLLDKKYKKAAFILLLTIIISFGTKIYIYKDSADYIKSKLAYYYELKDTDMLKKLIEKYDIK